MLPHTMRTLAPTRVQFYKITTKTQTLSCERSENTVLMDSKSATALPTEGREERAGRGRSGDDAMLPVPHPLVPRDLPAGGRAAFKAFPRAGLGQKKSDLRWRWDLAQDVRC